MFDTILSAMVTLTTTVVSSTLRLSEPSSKKTTTSTSTTMTTAKSSNGRTHTTSQSIITSAIDVCDLVISSTLTGAEKMLSSFQNMTIFDKNGNHGESIFSAVANATSGVMGGVTGKAMVAATATACLVLYSSPFIWSAVVSMKTSSKFQTSSDTAIKGSTKVNFSDTACTSKTENGSATSPSPSPSSSFHLPSSPTDERRKTKPMDNDDGSNSYYGGYDDDDDGAHFQQRKRQDQRLRPTDVVSTTTTVQGDSNFFITAKDICDIIYALIMYMEQVLLVELIDVMSHAEQSSSSPSTSTSLSLTTKYLPGSESFSTSEITDTLSSVTSFSSSSSSSSWSSDNEEKPVADTSIPMQETMTTATGRPSAISSSASDQQGSSTSSPGWWLHDVLRSEWENAVSNKLQQVLQEYDMDESCLEEATSDYLQVNLDLYDEHGNLRNSTILTGTTTTRTTTTRTRSKETNVNLRDGTNRNKNINKSKIDTNDQHQRQKQQNNISYGTNDTSDRRLDEKLFHDAKNVQEAFDSFQSLYRSVNEILVTSSSSSSSSTSSSCTATAATTATTTSDRLRQLLRKQRQTQQEEIRRLQHQQDDDGKDNNNSEKKGKNKSKNYYHDGCRHHLQPQ